MGKVERMRPRPPDGQEGWKEGSEDRGGNKASWADSADPRAPSPGSMGQYSKSAATQDYQVDTGSINLPSGSFKQRGVQSVFIHILVLCRVPLVP